MSKIWKFKIIRRTYSEIREKFNWLYWHKSYSSVNRKLNEFKRIINRIWIHRFWLREIDNRTFWKIEKIIKSINFICVSLFNFIQIIIFYIFSPFLFRNYDDKYNKKMTKILEDLIPQYNLKYFDLQLQ